MKKVIISLCILAFPLNAFALVKDDRIIVRGLRPMGMGGAFVAVADDENAVHYNPAGITQRQNGLIQAFAYSFWQDNEPSRIVFDAIRTLRKMTSKENFSVSNLATSNKYRGEWEGVSSFPNIGFILPPITYNNGNVLSIGFGQFTSVEAGAFVNKNTPHYVFDWL